MALPLLAERTPWLAALSLELLAEGTATIVAVATAGACCRRSASLEECACGQHHFFAAVMGAGVLAAGAVQCAAAGRALVSAAACDARHRRPLLHHWWSLLPSQPYVAPASASSPDARPTLPGQAAATPEAALAHACAALAAGVRLALASRLAAAAA